MKTFGRRTLSIILSVMMILSCFAGMTFSVGAVYGISGDYEYTEYTQGITTRRYYGSDTDVIVPSQINGIDVIEIGNPTFENCSNIKSITLPETLKYISHQAFKNCTGLTSITIPKNVIGFYYSAFEDCSGLKEIIVEDGNIGLESLDGVLFSKKNDKFLYYYDGYVGSPFDLSEIIICPAAKEGDYKIPDGIQRIADTAFDDCTRLTSITIPYSVTEIGKYSFSGCSSLTEINVDESSESYKSLDGILFNKDITKLVKYPGGRKGEYVIPDSVTTIGDSAFAGCSGLTSVTIPDIVTTIGDSAFAGCSGLTGVTIPDGVTTIGNSAFAGCSGLTSVTIPDSVTTIGNSAFAGCSGLTGVTIPDSVVEIGIFAFLNCDGLESVTIPDSVTKIGGCAFGGCFELKSVTIGKGVTTIGDGAFEGHPDLVFYGYSGSEAETYAIKNGYAFVSLNSCEHKETIIKNEKSATCTENGYSGDKYCKTCSKLIEKGTEIKALGHKFADGICTVCGETDPNYKPIENPTETPTEKPTEKPTESPTEKPTGAIIEPTTKAGDKLEFADHSNVDGKIDEENKKVSIVPSASAGISLDDFKAMFKEAVSVAGEKIENVFNGMKFTFNGNEYTFILKGDTSPDGKITAGDARTILRIAAKLEQPDEVTKEAADIDSDGKVTSAEARSVLRFAAKLQNKIYE